MSDNDEYVPALLADWLTPAYDLFAARLLPETQLKHELISGARITPDQRVLDLGVGTGTLAIMIKQIQPEARITGIDVDEGILAIAREKAARAGVEVTFDKGSAAALPYPDKSFDRVLASLVIVNMRNADKRLALRQAYRVLQPGGELHIADFGPPHTRWGHFIAPLLRRFDPISDHLDVRLPEMFQEAGFEYVKEGARFATLFGTLSILSGSKPGG